MARTKKEEIITDKAPKMLGPLNQGIRAGNFIFISAGPRDLRMRDINDDFEKAARQTLENVKAVLAAAGATMANIVRVDVYLKDMKYFDSFNRIYREYIPEPFPARSISQPARTPYDHLLAMVVTAMVG